MYKRQFLTSLTFKDEAEALEIANSTAYGLTGYLWTNDLTRALRFSDALEAGMIWVNSENVRHLPTPFGGVKASGIGRDGGDWSFEFYMEPVSYTHLDVYKRQRRDLLRGGDGKFVLPAVDGDARHRRSTVAQGQLDPQIPARRHRMTLATHLEKLDRHLARFREVGIPNLIGGEDSKGSGGVFLSLIHI